MLTFSWYSAPNVRNNSGTRSKYETEQKTGSFNFAYLSIWRTFQMSDHLPLWVELKIDFSNQYFGKDKRGNVILETDN
jgi:exonuclease III